MVAIKAHFDGKKITLPKELRQAPAGDVIVIFPELGADGLGDDWLAAQESAFGRVWDNDEDAVYDDL